ncbi:MAG: response regulator transcription factor [Myxococcota bacterium]
MNILIVEDNPDLAESVADFFEAKGDTAHIAGDADEAEHALDGRTFDAAIIDIMLPGGRSGVQLCRSLRRTASGATLPVLFLTALDALDDKLTGFEAGANDYLTKPFSLHELYARIRALTRRFAGATPDSDMVRVGELTIDVGQQTVHRGDRAIHLSESGFKLLVLLARRSPNLVEKQALERALWPHRTPDSDALKTHIYNLRKALHDAPSAIQLITVRGRGYRLVPEGR